MFQIGNEMNEAFKVSFHRHERNRNVSRQERIEGSYPFYFAWTTTRSSKLTKYKEQKFTKINGESISPLLGQ